MNSLMKAFAALAVLSLMGGCGTASGLGHGLGEVLTGMGDDFNALGDVFGG